MHEFVQQTPMSLDLDIGYASERGPREVNEDFVATRRPAPQEEHMGFICAIADGESDGGDGRMASQTSAKSLVEDYFGAPPTWGSNTVLDRLIVAQNSWLAAQGSAGLASNSLVAAAFAAGSDDNASALVIRVHGLGNPPRADALRNDWQAGQTQPGQSQGPNRRSSSAGDSKQNSPAAEEAVRPLQPGAVRPSLAAHNTPWVARDPVMFWKVGAALSVAINLLLIVWLLLESR